MYVALLVHMVTADSSFISEKPNQMYIPSHSAEILYLPGSNSVLTFMSHCPTYTS